MSIFYYSPPTSSKRQEFEKFKECKKRSREPECPVAATVQQRS